MSGAAALVLLAGFNHPRYSCTCNIAAENTMAYIMSMILFRSTAAGSGVSGSAFVSKL